MNGRTLLQPNDDFKIEPLRIISAIDLQGITVPDRQWLWQDWIPMGVVTAIYGDGGTGKSLLAQQLMTACATGREFLGQEVMQCNVLGFFCEDDEDELQRRQHKINQACGIDFADLQGVHWTSRVASENLMMTFDKETIGTTTTLYQQIVSAAKQKGVRLVIIDTAADTFGGNENIRPQVRQFISMLNRVAIEINGAVVLLAHPSQTGRNTGSGDGGSTAWNNSVRSRLYLKRPDAPEGELPDPDLRVLSRMKANYATTGEELSLRYQDGMFISEGLIISVQDGWSKERIAETDQAFLKGLQELSDKSMRVNTYKGQANYAPKALREKTNAAEGFSVDELAHAMNRLIKANRIESIEDGPQSRRRSFIRETSPDFPQLDGA